VPFLRTVERYVLAMDAPLAGLTRGMWSLWGRAAERDKD
jgi:hypothetical protein